jgi:hypothetical protein
MKKIQSKLFGLAAAAALLMVPGLASAACNVTAASALPYSVPAAGMTGAVAISAPAGCPWTFTARGSSWVRMLSATSGSGSATIYFQVLPNTTGRARSVGFGPEGVTTQSGGIGGRTSTVVVLSTGFTITMTQAAR